MLTHFFKPGMVTYTVISEDWGRRSKSSWLAWAIGLLNKTLSKKGGGEKEGGKRRGEASLWSINSFTHDGHLYIH